jgi:hypothetical protein
MERGSGETELVEKGIYPVYKKSNNVYPCVARHPVWARQRRGTLTLATGKPMAQRILL